MANILNLNPTITTWETWHGTRDGSSLFIISQENIWEARADGSDVRRILDLNPPLDPGDNHDPSRFGFHLDLSPDGSRMVYSTCEYPAARPEEMMIKRYGIPDMPRVEKEDLIGYELAIIKPGDLGEAPADRRQRDEQLPGVVAGRTEDSLPHQQPSTTQRIQRPV